MITAPNLQRPPLSMTFSFNVPSFEKANTSFYDIHLIAYQATYSIICINFSYVMKRKVKAFTF